MENVLKMGKLGLVVLGIGVIFQVFNMINESENILITIVGVIGILTLICFALYILLGNNVKKKC